MRDEFIDALIPEMASDSRIFFVSADFGSPKLDELRRKFPRRFINVGIAEQMLVNIAAGLALEGNTVYAYAIAPFLSMRPYEQIRVNLSMMSQTRPMNVTLVGVGAGLSYDISGPTHQAIEDISILRALPHIEVLSPCDGATARLLVSRTLTRKGISYLRFDSRPLPDLSEAISASDIDRGFRILEAPSNVALVATGYMTHRAIAISNALTAEHISAGVIDVINLSNPNMSAMSEVLNACRLVVTLEEGYTGRGGLDALIREVLSGSTTTPSVMTMGIKHSYVMEAAGREEMLRECGLATESAVSTITAAVNNMGNK